MKKYEIGYTCGVFDLLHTGHLNLLERCKSMCDYLIVGVCNDEYVHEIKKKEPVFSEQDRVRLLSALKCVDQAELVNVETTNNKMLALERFRFNVLFSGDDWKGTERYQRTEKEFAALMLSVKLDAPVLCRLDAPELDFACCASADCLHQHLQVI